MNTELEPPGPHKYGHDITVGCFVKTRTGYVGEVTEVTNGRVTMQLAHGLHHEDVGNVILTLTDYMHKIRSWCKAVDPTFNEMQSDYVVRGDFQHLKKSQVEARKQARALKKRPTA